MTVFNTHPCGQHGTHLPHQSRLLAGWWCPGVMPVWPCPAWPRQHASHIAKQGKFFCPGTTEPPREQNGPWYSHADVCAAIEASQEREEQLEEIEQ